MMVPIAFDRNDPEMNFQLGSLAVALLVRQIPPPAAAA